MTVEVDGNEQNPLTFPEQLIWTPERGKREVVTVRTERRRLSFGDYRLAGYPRGVVVERKAGLTELATNLFDHKDSVRFKKAWTRFVTGCRMPVLMIEDRIGNDKLAFEPERLTATDVTGELWKMILAEPRVTVIWAGNQTTAAARMSQSAQLLRMMLAGTRL